MKLQNSALAVGNQRCQRLADHRQQRVWVGGDFMAQHLARQFASQLQHAARGHLLGRIQLRMG